MRNQTTQPAANDEWQSPYGPSTFGKQVLWILGIGLLVRSIIAWKLPPGYDEAYYYLYTQNPAWSFFDHPPLVAITTALGIWLSGEQVSQFTIRVGTLLMHTATLAFLYLAARRLFGETVGRLSLLFASIIPIFLVAFGTLTLPDVPLMFFWVVVLWGSVEEFFGDWDGKQAYRPSYRLAIIALFVGLAFTGKYHGALLGAGLVGFCWTSAPFRRALWSPWLLLGLAGFAVTIAPVMLWNADHNWISFTFQAGRSVPATQYSLLRLLEVIGVQCLYLFPTLGVPLMWVTVRDLLEQLRSPFIRRIRVTSTEVILKKRLILWLSAPVFVPFTLIGGYRQVLPTWTMPGWFLATILLAIAVDRWQQKAPKITGRWLTGTILTIPVILAIALFHVSDGIAQKPSQTAILGGLLPADQDPSIQLLDVVQLRDRFRQDPNLMRALTKSDFTFSNRFHLAGHFAMALDPLFPLPMTCFDRNDMRGFSYWSNGKDWVGKTGLYLTTDEFQTPPEDSAQEFRPYFKQFEKVGVVSLQRGGVQINQIHVYLGKTLIKPYPRPRVSSQGA
jgi:4-amino-4-deoxy-L-arabinose transferase-like glycosyltransferase